MSVFRDFVISFCTISVCLGGLSLLCPDGKLEKTLRYVFGLVFLVCLLNLLPVFKNIEIPTIQNETAQLASENELNLHYMELVLRTALTKNGIEFEEITVCTDIPAEDGIEMYKVLVKTSESKEKILEVLGETGANCEIEVQNE